MSVWTLAPEKAQGLPAVLAELAFFLVKNVSYLFIFIYFFIEV